MELVVTMAPSISLEQGTELIMEIERELLTFAPVAETVARIGRPEAGSHPHPVNMGEIFVKLKAQEEWGKYRNKADLIADMQEALKPFPGIQLNFSQPIQALFGELLSGIRADLAIKVYGEDLALLREKAEAISAAIDTVPGLEDVSAEKNYGQPQIQIRAKRDVCAREGVSVAEIMEVVELAIGGEVIDSIYLNTRRFGIHIRFQEKYRADVAALRDIMVPTMRGTVVPLSQVADVDPVTGPIQINRENNQRRWTVQGNVRGRDLGSVVADIKRAITKAGLDPTKGSGYEIVIGGQFENQQRAMKRLSIIVAIVICLVLVMLWMSFGSMRHALIIIVNVPLALIGGIVGLLVMGEYLSVPASVGFIALFGIAVQNGMVLVTYFNDLRQQGRSVAEAVSEGSELRLRPVLMTALTTVLGLMPLLLAAGIGSDVQRPLATVVVFGLTTSTLLTLFVIPAVYSWVEERAAR